MWVKNGIIDSMKNLQQGFIVPVILAIVSVLVVGGGVYIYKNKKITEIPTVNNIETQRTSDQISPIVIKQDTSNNKIYKHPSNLYGFSYPSDWIVSEVMGGIVFSDLGKKERIGETSNYTYYDHEFGIYIVDKDPKIKAKAMAEYLGQSYMEEDVKIGGISAKRMVYKETRAENHSYVIPLKGEKFIVISVTARDGSDAWLSKGYGVTQTMFIDTGRDNIDKAENQDNKIKIAEDKKEGDRVDLIVKKYLMNMPATAEIYLDSHKNYAGFCNSRERSNYMPPQSVRDMLGDRPFSCTDGDSFAVSAKLYNGEYFCADSKNFSGAISSLHTANACK